MDLDWLADFAALAEHGSFSRAAAARHVTQPAFSRRIRALEDWVGAPLFVRSVHGATLTTAGEEMRAAAGETLRRLQQMRDAARLAAGKETATLTFAATHALSFTFFPRWIRGCDTGGGAIRLISDSMAACEEVLQRGQAQFLLCHHHADAPARFEPGRFESIVVGADRLMPLSAAEAGAARFRLADRTPRLLGYGAESGLGRTVAACLADHPDLAAAKPLFTSHLAATLLSMALDGAGVAWLPLSLAEGDVAAGRLADAGDGRFQIALEIRLVRPASRLSAAAEALWARLACGGDTAS